MNDILHAAIVGLSSLFTLEVFLFMLIGIAAGMFLGIMPGMGGLTGMGLLLPFAIGHPPEVAFAFLLGMYAVTTQTDSIPAVLIGVPGTSAAQATYLEGYPMAKRGEASRALSASYFSSVWGTLIFALLFLFIIPVIRPIINMFGAPEFFAFAIFGLSLAGTLVGDNVIRGLTIATLGLFLATIGFTGATGEARYTLGFIYLEDGLPLIPVALGLFAVPELINLMARGSSIAQADGAAVEKGGAWRGFKDTVNNRWLVLRCACLGGLSGVVPGLGGTVTEWLAYGHAKNSAKGESHFGHGDVRGIIAPETAGAAQKPGALLPTVALGIPGNASMAILMGAFLIVGLQPGKEMLNEQLPLTFQMVWTVVVANFVVAVVCLLMQRWLVKICYIPVVILAPIILSLMLVGAAVNTGTFADILVFALAGIVGYLMVRSGWPRVPLIIGLVLGPLVETNFVITSQIYGYSWLWSRPIVIVLLGLAVFTILKSTISGVRGKNNNHLEIGDRKSVNIMALRSLSWWLGAAIALLSLMAIFTAMPWEYETRLFPVGLAGFMFVFSLIHNIVELLTPPESPIKTKETPVVLDPPNSLENTRRAELRYFVWIGFLLMTVYLLGFIMGLPLFTYIFMTVHRITPKISLPAALGIWVFTYLLMFRVLGISGPDALVFRLL